MAVILDLDEYRRIQAKRIAYMKTWTRKGPLSAAKFMALQCRIMAPKKTGTMLSTIHRRGATVEVRGTSPSGFPYIHWVNATPGTGMEILKFPHGAWIPPSQSYNGKWTMIAPPGAIAKYGFTPNWHWTGVPGFFWKAEDLTRDFFRDMMLRNTRNMLKAEFI
jgi:hypothetical protein